MTVSPNARGEIIPTPGRTDSSAASRACNDETITALVVIRPRISNPRPGPRRGRRAAQDRRETRPDTARFRYPGGPSSHAIPGTERIGFDLRKEDHPAAAIMSTKK